jgi:hypothetical protein
MIFRGWPSKNTTHCISEGVDLGSRSWVGSHFVNCPAKTLYFLAIVKALSLIITYNNDVIKVDTRLPLRESFFCF